MGRSGSKRKRKDELLVVESDYRPPKCSYGLWKQKKIDLAKKLPIEEQKLRKEKEKEKEAREKAVEDGPDKLWASNAFDMGEFSHYRGMSVFTGFDRPLLVKLYAMLGLHRHNMVEGTDLQLHDVEHYNRHGWPICAAYYISSLAHDPASGSCVPFRTLAEEGKYNAMNVTFPFAKLKKPENKYVDDEDNHFYDASKAPEWPLRNAFNKISRFYKLQKSEWEANDWIRLYLELALVATSRDIPSWDEPEPDLSALRILDVVFETFKEPPNARVLKHFTSAHFYITYEHDLGEDGICRRRAIVRRIVNPKSKQFRLVGKILEDST